MTATRAARDATTPAEPGGGWFSGLRRGRHRKPRPRRAWLAAGGLVLAAGVLSLVRMSPESGVGAPGTAAAEPRLDPGGGLASDGTGDGGRTAGGPAGTTATAVGTAVPALPHSAATAPGRRSPAPAPTGSAARPGGSGRTVPPAPGKSTAPSAPPRPTATAPAPPAPTSHPTQPPAPTPAPSTPAPGPGGLCLPIIVLCVDVLDGHGG
ncbi:hypothetical protein [Streptomyces sp. KHY 26]|uniref:hypothetical protein n=1 Tax=Streptomyces sp. KHY 26 TaxID=3097359 RepID=UPI00376F2A03